MHSHSLVNRPLYERTRHRSRFFYTSTHSQSFDSVMLVSMKLAQIFLTAAVAVATVSGSAIATAAPLYTVSQGDEILIGAPGYFPSHSCTLGFNGDGYSYTAAHCGDTGDLVYIEDSNGLLKGPLGTVTNSPLYSGFDDDQETYNDWARIDWNDSVRLGENRFSGDTIVPLSEVQLGETVCVYGNTTKRENCGNFAGSTETTFFVDRTETAQGDSGGPLWIPGKGLVGVLSGSMQTTALSTLLFDRYNIDIDLTRATAPGIDGKPFTFNDSFQVIRQWDRLGRPDHVVTPAEQPNLGGSNSTAKGSSNLTQEEIWGIVGGVISLISVLLGLARQFGVLG